jgi:hypothetical protein
MERSLRPTSADVVSQLLNRANARRTPREMGQTRFIKTPASILLSEFMAAGTSNNGKTGSDSIYQNLSLDSAI